MSNAFDYSLDFICFVVTTHVTLLSLNSRSVVPEACELPSRQLQLQLCPMSYYRQSSVTITVIVLDDIKFEYISTVHVIIHSPA